ncbi:MAG TPA: alkaline phosphatase family protein [Patescibacteria group bacterium]|nr:alkaline phosphatase family protein [Patescibacteria group bacterium]
MQEDRTIFKKKGKKLLIIGLDGVSHEMLTGNGQPSLLPALNKFFATSTVKMSVSIPEISAVSWSSFMTGTQAGNHGIFGFVDLVPGTYQYRFPNFSDLKATTFFDELGLKDKRSVIINLPATYPARPIPGVMISGFVALDLEKAVFPSSYIPILKQMGYQIDVDAGKGRDKKAEFLADLHCALKIRKQIADILWEKEKWDVFMFTVTETDRLQHFLYDAYSDSRHPYKREFNGLYHEVDQIAAAFLQRAAAAGNIEIVALSDHGFAPIKSEVYLNPILKKYGYFSLEKAETRSLASISPQARAFALDPSRIYIHQKDKYFKGGVAKSDVQKVGDDLKQLFENYEINGEKIIRKAYFKEELYSGAQMAAAPDLVLLSKPGYDLKGGLEKDQETGTSYFTGMHRQDNAFFACSRGELMSKPLTIFDVKGLLYKLLAI